MLTNKKRNQNIMKGGIHKFEENKEEKYSEFCSWKQKGEKKVEPEGKSIITQEKCRKPPSTFKLFVPKLSKSFPNL